jgi:acyl-CoA thioesterase-1
MNRLAALAAALGLAGLAVAAGAADADDTVASEVVAESALASCAVPPALMVIEPAETRIAGRLDRREPLTIVAFGSSSTLGTGASAPELSYPSRLEAELKDRFPSIVIRVINRGKGGDDVAEELARLNQDVIPLHPDLVIWQVGTNAVLRRDDLSADSELIKRGVAQLKASGSDVVLMDMQYAPRVIARPAYAEMERLIANAAKSARIGLFRRFEIMQHRQAMSQADAAAMIGRDELHMTDRGYFCLAANLAEALAWNWWRSWARTSARPRRGSPAWPDWSNPVAATKGREGSDAGLVPAAPSDRIRRATTESGWDSHRDHIC